MTALITGFPGFIGRRLVRALLDQHADLHIVALVEEPRKKRLQLEAERAAARGQTSTTSLAAREDEEGNL